jgi:hypothetical protein
MAITMDLFEKIREEYGQYASWAIWAEDNKYSEGVRGMDIDIFQNVTKDILSQLNPNFVILGLNWSKGSPGILMNFHSRDSNIGKLRYAVRNSPLHGAYMTDIIKNHSEPNSKELMKYLQLNPRVEKENVRDFENEISILEIEDPVIIANGKNVYEILKRNHIAERYKVIKITHYSAPFGKNECPKGKAGEYHKRRVMPDLVQGLNCKPW